MRKERKTMRGGGSPLRMLRAGGLIVVAAAMLVVLTLVSCSSQKNTARSRWFHAFHARYNIYYNGAQAYIDASLEREQGNVDNFTEMIPLYTVGNKNSRELGKANFERAIEKSQKAIQRHSMKRRPEWKKRRRKTDRDIEWLNRKEYNPFLWKAWMLMGRSQFHEGNFDEAASTFAYMSRLYATQPAIYGKARAWLAKCYVEQDWVYDAEDVITKIRRDSIHWRARKEWDYTLADYYIHTHRYEEAIPYLRQVIHHEMRRKQRAREWFLLGQLYTAVGQNERAYKAYRRVLRLYPPYQLEFNARIAMTEVMSGGKPKQMIRKLKRMAASDKNKDYLDQVYYAIGNIYLAQNDTTEAIAAYEKGNSKATRSGIEKGVLLLRLGGLYWEREEFSDARRCYGEAIGLLDKDRDDYEQLSKRSKLLDELVPYTEAVELQDSLLELSVMPEDERNAAIDRVIEALKKKEKEERRAQQEAEAAGQLAEQQQQGSAGTTTSSSTTDASSSTFYFYNPTAVSQGKATFEKLWGKRENADDWQRANKTVVATDEYEEIDEEELTDEQRDSIMAAEALQDSIDAAAEDPVNDPHKREYYLAQIPFTPEQKATAHSAIMDGLYNSGVIFKDKFYNLILSEKQLLRLINDYSVADDSLGIKVFDRMADVYYHLFLLYSQRGDHDIAATYLERLKSEYPEHQWTTLLSDPNYAVNMRIGKHLEDSLYADTYDAFKAGRYSVVKHNTAFSAERFPLGDNRDRFIFIDGLTRLNEGDSEACLEAMNKVVNDYPKSDVAEMAGMIVNGVKEGRRLQGGTFDIGNIWSRRTAVLNDSDSIAARHFVAERDVPFVTVIAYRPDSIDQNRLLFEVARFNFSNFVVRNFSMTFDDDGPLRRMIISGFKSYDEARQYTRQLYASVNDTGTENPSPLAEQLSRTRVIIISATNFELLGQQFSYDDYDLFYDAHYVPLKISTVRLLTEPAEIDFEPEPETAEEPADTGGEQQDDGMFIDEGLYNGGVLDDDMLYELEIEPETTDDGLTLPDDGQPDEPTGNEPAEPADDGNSIFIPAEEETTVVEEEQTAVATEEPDTEEETTVPDDGDGALYLPDEEETTVVEEETPGETRETVTPQPDILGGQPAEPASPAEPEEPEEPEEELPADDDNTYMIIEDPEPANDDDTGIDFNDDFFSVPATPQDSRRQQQEFNIEDEYYDLDGF